MQRPGRPLGVTLAIFASVMLFTVFPLIIVAMVLIVASHFSRIDFGEMEIYASGGDFLGVSPVGLVVQTVVAILFFVIAIFAWRGRPSYMRYVMAIAVILLTLFSLGVTIIQSSANQSFAQGTSSLDSLLGSVSCGQFVLSTLVSFYVIWYLNRGPARAFYRGYYLPDPNTTAESDSG
jgi:hypothetical protein